MAIFNCKLLLHRAGYPQIYPTPQRAGMAPAGHHRRRRAQEPRGLPASAPAMGNPGGRKMELWFFWEIIEALKNRPKIYMGH